MFDKVLDTFWKETIDFVLVILVLKKYKHCSDVITITLNIFWLLLSLPSDYCRKFSSTWIG